MGVMYYAALLPCVIAAIIAAEFATGMGIDPETFPVHSIPGLTVETGLKMALIAVGCGILSILFCILLKIVGQLYTKYLKNPYIRIVVAAGVIILITICLNTKRLYGSRKRIDRKELLKTVKQDHLIFYGKCYLQHLRCGQDIVVVRLYRHSVLVQHLDVLPVEYLDFHRN